ncbi:protein TEX261 [Dermatophagoides farinae]|uniref:Protein TEX261 n=1 Tax=Dermatophagoides farinae TaxID=6954 RepID=A0A922IB79_DERFA|nr:protein TEX261-like [Dermatophagoides farinae]KAH7636241.1 transmembrane adaptor erv26-like protein [Dermatophagoides farinae]KAH9528289.1 hypothetical protein DERF_002245 [Dermatophagoides farinae]
MWFFILLSWLGIVVLLLFFVLSLATGLYYLAELIEEYTTVSCKIIRQLNLFIIAIYVGLFLFENLPSYLIICGLLSHLNNMVILKTFPFFQLSSPSFIFFIVMLVINHYLAFTYFAQVNLYFVQVLSYFTVCLWIIPFAFFVSLSANDNVLPTSIENRNSDDHDLISHYFSRKGTRPGLLSIFNYAKESILPQQVKKSY